MNNTTDTNTRNPVDEPAHASTPMPAAEPRSETGNGRDHASSLRTEKSAATLLRELIGDVAVLLRKELALAASEVTQSVNDAKRGVGSMVSGGAVLYAGLLFLLAAAAFGLALVMPAWAATLIVGGVAALVGFIMLQSGKKTLEPDRFVPDRTAESMRKDKEAIRRQTP